MSRALRRRQLSMISSLEKANRAFKEAFTKSAVNEEGVLQLLADCQDTAILMGNEIEAVYGDGTASVAGLEEYCESLYEMTLVIGDFKRRREKLGILEGQLKRLRKTVSSEMPDKLEAVFLPYKASMWDSLESVWMAAKEDENCDAYVIPIPYFDKNPDGSFREMHYEGGEYPDYVPVTHYKDYDFAGRHPDMIFIHNPYDEYNYVTSVEPFFYSKNLKKYTDKLIYIPYFVLGEIDPENEEALKGIEHFCVVQGVVNADKVIVQSEAMREAYVKVLTKQTGEKTKKYWEEKILGLGSPKTDKVLSTRREDVQIPEEWKRIIWKSDGSRKKIILYNTSVNALLRHEEKMLEKMRTVFHTFKENQDEAALLWRPHPLIKATIESMRPTLWGEYQKLAEEYKEENWGIYDDTADMDRALALCDAYYGDESSLVHLCQEAGKPVMIQNVDIM